MKFLISAILILLAAGCASNGTSSSKDAPSDVTQQDFVRPKPFAFVPSQDFFAKVPGDKENQALRYESAQRIDAGDIGDGDVISQLVQICQEGEFDQATGFIRKNYDRYRDNPAFWNQVAVCYMLQKNNKTALLYFNKSLDYKRDYSPAYNNLGVMYWRMNEMEKALAAFSRAAEYGPFTNTPKINLGFLYLQYQLSEKAEPLFEGLYKSGPKDLDVLTGLMTSYLFNNNFENAQKVCQHAPELLERPAFGINCAKAFFYGEKVARAREILSNVDTDKLGAWDNYYAKTKKLVGGDK